MSASDTGPDCAEITTSATKKKTVLFIGSFIPEKAAGSTGGQMFACRTLIDSRLSQHVHWVLVDSTGTLPPRPVTIRALLALGRILKCTYYLLTRRIDTTLVFSAHGVSFMEKGLIVLLSRLTGRRTLLAPRSGLITDDLEKPWMRNYIRLVLHKATLVVCQSPHWQRTFQDVAQRAHYEVIHNWIDSSVYAQTVNHREPGEPMRLLYLGWVTRDKGVYELFDAVARLSRRHAIKLHICGHGDAFTTISENIIKYNLQSSIELRGWVGHAEKLREFQEADMFVQPTHYEGFPNSLLEAMSASVPVVCSDIPAISSLVTDKHNCIQFRAKDVDSLVTAIEQLLVSAEMRSAIAVNARTLVEQKFSIDYGIAAFERII